MRTLMTSIRTLVLFVVLTGVVFPVAIWLIGQKFFPFQANGSLIENKQGKLIGSAIIAQQFTSARYFHPRPSAAGAGYDATSSGGTNLGPTSSKLFDGMVDDPTTPGVDESFTGVKQLAVAYRQENALTDDALVPVDAVTRSASGLDPDISLTNARIQASRIGKERALTIDAVKKIIDSSVQPRFLGIFGEPRVNVLQLNTALDHLSGG